MEQQTRPHFTLIGATTKLGNLTSPMRERFGVVLRLNFYSNKELADIITRSAKLLKISTFHYLLLHKS